MTRIVLLIGLVIFSVAQAFTQNITVVNSLNDDPIPGVIISDTAQTKYRVSNSRGIVNISTFTKYDLILIQHNYFLPLIISMDSVRSLNYIIALHEQTFQMEGFTVLANKWEQDKSELPVSITEIRPKEINFQSPQTTPDMLSNTGKVFVQKSQLGGGSPMIRGFSANSVLLVVDGVRMNNAIFRSGNLQNSLNIDPNSLGHAEVIFGPGSVTYGSDALGGVMDFHTKEAKFCTDGKFDLDIDAFTRASSVNSEATIGFGLDLKWKKFSSHTQFLRSDFSNLHAGRNHFGNYPDFGKRKFVVGQNALGNDTMVNVEDATLMVPSYFSVININQKFRYKPNNKMDITYSYILSTTSDIPRYDRLVQYKGDKLKYAEWYYGAQNWTMHNLRLRLFRGNKFYDSGRIILAFQRFDESRHDRKFGKTKFRHRSERVDLYTLNLDFSKKINTKTSLYYGAELAVNSVNSAAYSRDTKSNDIVLIQTRYPNESNIYSSAGAFVNLKHKISPKLSILMGLRYSVVSLNSTFDTTLNGLPFNNISLVSQAPNGSIGLAYKLRKDLQINANIGSGFRAPNLDDVAKVFDSEPGSVVVPNENLMPEYVYSAELSIIKSFGEIAQLELTAYASYIDNIIVRRDYTYKSADSIMYDGSMSKVQAMQNDDNGTIFGGVASLNININEHIKFRTVYNIATGKSADGNSLRHVAPNFGSMSLSYENKYFKASIFSNYSAAIAFDDLAPSEQSKTYMYTADGAEKWFTLNFKTDIKLYKNLHLNLAVENILDRFYIPYSSGIPAPGRNFMIGLHLYPF